jgi:hypothetical protein
LISLLDDDFVSDCDLLVACTILQKQIEHIDGKKDNIIVPSVAMTKVREKEQAGNCLIIRAVLHVCMNDIVEARGREQKDASVLSSTNSSNNSDVEMATSSESNTTEINVQSSVVAAGETIKHPKSSLEENTAQNHTDDASPSNPCVLCLSEEKRLACIPCGHLATCVPCGHSLRSCPICRRQIDAFVRIYT